MLYLEKEFIVPDLKAQADVTDILEKLETAPGIERVAVDLPNHRVVVWMADHNGELDVRKRLSDAGFPAEEDE